jgi:transposase
MTDATTFIGLDVHAATITGAAITPDGELRRLGTFATTPEVIAERAAGWGEPATLSVVYEAGPCGYGLARQLAQLGIACQVIAPALTPQRPGDRIKTDRRDAEKLAVGLAKGLLTPIPIPSPAQEALRSLSRARHAAVGDQHRVRQRLIKFLRIQGIAEPAGKRWTQKWWSWALQQTCAEPLAQVVLDELRTQIEDASTRVERLTAQVEQHVETAPQREQIAVVQQFYGIGAITAVGIVAESGDLRRFASAPAFMAYTGLVPSEHSSGRRQQRGGITRTGNAHLRFLLVEAAWHYSRHQPKQDVPEPTDPVAQLAWKARRRLHRKYARLLFAGKRPAQAVTAVARELAGFVWAAAQVPRTA